jgi:hypothetical protein
MSGVITAIVRCFLVVVMHSPVSPHGPSGRYFFHAGSAIVGFGAIWRLFNEVNMLGFC